MSLQSHNNPSIAGYARILLMIIPYFLVVGIFQFIGMLFTKVDIENFDISILSSEQHLIISCFDLVGNFLLLWVFVKFIDKENFKAVGFNLSHRLKDIIVGIVLGLGIMGLAMLGLLFFSEIEIETINYSGKDLVQILLIFIIVALVEETLLRGYVLKNLMYSFNKYIALFVSSLLFAVMHIANPNMDWFSFLNLFLAGILLGISYVYTKNLWFPIALHFSWNFFQSLFGFNVSGQDIYSLIEFNITEKNIINGGDFGFEGSIFSIIVQIILIVSIFIYYQKKHTYHEK